MEAEGDRMMTNTADQPIEDKWKKHKLNWDRLIATGSINVTTDEMKVLVRKLSLEDYEFYYQQINENCWSVEVS